MERSKGRSGWEIWKQLQIRQEKERIRQSDWRTVQFTPEVAVAGKHIPFEEQIKISIWYFSALQVLFQQSFENPIGRSIHLVDGYQQSEIPKEIPQEMLEELQDLPDNSDDILVTLPIVMQRSQNSNINVSTDAGKINHFLQSLELAFRHDQAERFLAEALAEEGEENHYNYYYLKPRDFICEATTGQLWTNKRTYEKTNTEVERVYASMFPSLEK